MTRTWIRIGAFAGIVAALAYPSLLLIPLPLAGVAAVASLFGVSLSLAAVGGYQFIGLNRKTVTLQIGCGANFVAGVLVLLMLLIQLSVNDTMESLLAQSVVAGTEATVRMIWQAVDKVQLGVDVAWDVYIAFGTLLIAWNLRKHPRYGPIFAWPGILLALALLVLNLGTFPIPPAEAELIDMGPFVGLWSLAMSIQMVRSLKWADEQLQAQEG